MEIFLNKKKKSRIYVDFFLPKKKKKNQPNKYINEELKALFLEKKLIDSGKFWSLITIEIQSSYIMTFFFNLNQIYLSPQRKKKSNYLSYFHYNSITQTQSSLLIF